MNRRRSVNLFDVSNQSKLKSSSTRRSARRFLAKSAPVLMSNNWSPPVPQLPSRTAVMSLRKSVKMSPRTFATRYPRRSRSSDATMSMKLNMGKVSQPTQLSLLIQLNLNTQLSLLTQLNLITQLDQATQLNLITQLNPLTQLDQATHQR